MSFVKKAHSKPRLHVCVNLVFGAAWPPCFATPPSSQFCYTAIPLPMITMITAIPLAMITIRKSIHGFPFLSMGMGLSLAAFGRRSSDIKQLNLHSSVRELKFSVATYSRQLHEKRKPALLGKHRYSSVAISYIVAVYVEEIVVKIYLRL